MCLAAFFEPPRNEDPDFPNPSEEVGELLDPYQSPELENDFKSKQRTAEVLGHLYPEGDEVLRMIAISAAKRGDLKTAREYFEQALATGVKTDEDNFYLYIQVLVEMGAPQSEIDAAVKKWRYNFPFSNRPDPTKLPKAPPKKFSTKAEDSGSTP